MPYGYRPQAGAGGAGPLNPGALQQRNAITNSLMSIASPLPRTPLPNMPPVQPTMGLPPTPPPGAPPQGAPTPQAAPSALPLSPGVPPQQMPGMQGMPAGAPPQGGGVGMAPNPMTMATGRPQGM